MEKKISELQKEIKKLREENIRLREIAIDEIKNVQHYVSLVNDLQDLLIAMSSKNEE